VNTTHEWAAVTAAQILNLCVRDAPKHEIFSDVQRVLETLLIVALMEMRETMLKPSEN
jgi:hypothetical protein